ncbi:hypothetical protein BGW38_000242, partial [Lunasporangiospora selenospora]
MIEALKKGCLRRLQEDAAADITKFFQANRDKSARDATSSQRQSAFKEAQLALTVLPRKTMTFAEDYYRNSITDIISQSSAKLKNDMRAAADSDVITLWRDIVTNNTDAHHLSKIVVFLVARLPRPYHPHQ